MADAMSVVLGQKSLSDPTPREVAAIHSISQILNGTDMYTKKQAMDKLIGWAFTCVNAISEEIGNMEIELYQIKSSGEHVRVWDHEVLDLLEGVNDYMTGFDLRYLVGSHLEATGNAFLLLDGVENMGDKPTAMHVLDPSCVSVVVSKESLPYRLSGYKFRDGFLTKDLQPYQVLHIKYPNPKNVFEGKGTIQKISKWLESDDFADEFNRAFFKNGAKLGGVIEAASAMTPEQMKVLKESFADRHQGVSNAHRVGIMPSGSKYVEMGQSLKDMDFSTLSVTARDKILAGFRVPRTVLGITDDVNRANAEATDYVYAKRTIKPKYTMITSCINEFLIPLFGQDLYVRAKDPVPENEEMQIKKMTAGTGGQAVISINEARDEYLGLGPIQGGDSVMGDFSKVPIGRPIDEKEVGQQRGKSKKAAERNAEKRSPISRHYKNHLKRKQVSDDIAESLSKALAENIKKMKRGKLKGIENLTDEEFEPFYKSFRERVTNFEQLLLHKVQIHNVVQKDEVLNNLENAIKSISERTKGIDPEELFNQKDNVVAMIDLAAPVLVDLYEGEAAEAANMIGMTGIEELNAETLARIDHAVELMSESYNETTRRQLKAKLEDGLQAGASIDQLKEIVSDVYDFADKTRALRVARTESFRIANEASKDVWKTSGVVKTIKWYTAADERVCEWCYPQHGKVVSIESNFYNIGDQVVGTDGGVLNIEYADVEAGSLHASCRCYTRPETIEI